MAIGSATVRPCVPGDEHALALLGAATFLETYAGILDGQDIVGHSGRQHATSVYADWLADGHTRLWIAEVEPGAAPIGYLVLARPDLPVPSASGDLEVRRIYVLERYQRVGIGRRLMEAAEAHVRSCGGGRLLLGVYMRNAAALAFYERVGYRQVGTRRFDVGNHYYDDHVLALDVPGSPH
jgi:ribosomal protein S18 acetylase RimI-like enzyme